MSRENNLPMLVLLQQHVYERDRTVLLLQLDEMMMIAGTLALQVRTVPKRGRRQLPGLMIDKGG
jgi:hypothetical protein